MATQFFHRFFQNIHQQWKNEYDRGTFGQESRRQDALTLKLSNCLIKLYSTRHRSADQKTIQRIKTKQQKLSFIQNVSRYQSPKAKKYNQKSRFCEQEIKYPNSYDHINFKIKQNQGIRQNISQKKKTSFLDVMSNSYLYYDRKILLKEVCIICKEQDSNIRLACAHTAHSQCFYSNKQLLCPLCQSKNMF